MSVRRLGSLALVFSASGLLCVASATRAADPLPSPTPAQVVPRGNVSVPSPLPNPKGTQQVVPRGDVRLVAPEEKLIKGRSNAKKPLIAPPSLLLQPAGVIPFTAPGLGKVDLNRASLEQIQRLPGVGLEWAPRILAGRPYRTLGDLSRTGVPLTTIDAISQKVEFGP